MGKMEQRVKVCGGRIANVSHLSKSFQKAFNKYPYSCGWGSGGFCGCRTKPELCSLTDEEYNSLQTVSLYEAFEILRNR